MLLNFYLSELEEGDGEFFEFIGLPRDASWGQLRRHYDKDGLPDIERNADDLLAFPPVTKKIAELGGEKENKVVWLKDWIERRKLTNPEQE
jgi:hypothetical protein